MKRLVIFTDDCPRTGRPIEINYCKRTQCLYFLGVPLGKEKIAVNCDSPKAENNSIETAQERINYLKSYYERQAKNKSRTKK